VKRNTLPRAESRKRLERIFEENKDFVWRLLRRLGLSREHADDMTQQAFLIATERLDDIKRGSERSFLFGTALRLARTTSRTDRRWVLDEDVDHRISIAPSAEELGDQHVPIALLDGVLSCMQVDLVTVFILFELEAMSVPEIARLLAIPVGTAASRLRRAREVFHASVSRIGRARRGGKP
jgi:RNA polymerase sigma-70 factor (ECF subfamily)